MPKQSRYVFARVPGYETFTGDRRVWTTPRRKEFVCFVIDTETMKGVGFKAPTLQETKVAADQFNATMKFPDGSGF